MNECGIINCNVSIAPSELYRDKRRSNVWKLEMPGMVKCSHCGEYILAHRVCKTCGYYDGKQVINTTEEA